MSLTMPDGQGEVLLSPTSADGVHVASTDAAALDLDVDVVVTKGLGLELILVEVQPAVRPVDLKAGELLRIGHCARRRAVKRITRRGKET